MKSQSGVNPVLLVGFGAVALWLFMGGGEKFFKPTDQDPLPINVDDLGTGAEFSRVTAGKDAKEDLLFYAAYLDALADKIEADGRLQQPVITDHHMFDRLIDHTATLHTFGAMGAKYGDGFADIVGMRIAKAVDKEAGPLTAAERAEAIGILRASAAGARKAAG